MKKMNEEDDDKEDYDEEDDDDDDHLGEAIPHEGRLQRLTGHPCLLRIRIVIALFLSSAMHWNTYFQVLLQKTMYMALH